MNHLDLKRKEAREHICMALDFDNEKEILSYVEELCEYIGYFKLNYAYTLFGAELIKKIKAYGVKLFLDLKLHDIPNTLSGYACAISKLNIDIINLHTSGGYAMMKAFMDSLNENFHNITPPKVIGVTLTTNIDQDIMNDELNIKGNIHDEILRRAKLAERAGLDGIVCSAKELPAIKQFLPKDFYYITPGVRAKGISTDDHKRAVSFYDAISAGSSLLVIGRDLLTAEDKRTYVKSIIDEIIEKCGYSSC